MDKTHVKPSRMTEAFQSEDEIEKIFQRAVAKALTKQAAADTAKPKTTGGPLKAGTASSPAAK